jgi:hypothetical protein
MRFCMSLFKVVMMALWRLCPTLVKRGILVWYGYGSVALRFPGWSESLKLHFISVIVLKTHSKIN